MLSNVILDSMEQEYLRVVVTCIKMMIANGKVNLDFTNSQLSFRNANEMANGQSVICPIVLGVENSSRKHAQWPTPTQTRITPKKG